MICVPGVRLAQQNSADEVNRASVELSHAPLSLSGDTGRREGGERACFLKVVPASLQSFCICMCAHVCLCDSGAETP